MKIWGSICAKNESTALCFVLYICLCLQSLSTCSGKSVYAGVYVVCWRRLNMSSCLFFLCCFYCRPYCRFVLSCFSVLLTVVLFCHLNGHLNGHRILSSYSVVLFCRLVLSSCSVVLNVIIFCRLVLSSCSVILTVVLLCRPNCHLQNKNKISHVSLVSRNILQPLEHEKKPIGKLL